MEMQLAAVVLPVSDVDRAKAFYRRAGFVEDYDYVEGGDYRVVKLTPLGSSTSIVLGQGITAAAPGSVQGLHLAVRDIESVRTELLVRGIQVGDVFHDSSGVFNHLSRAFAVPGPDPEQRANHSFARFRDPDGNGWILQEAQGWAPPVRGLTAEPSQRLLPAREDGTRCDAVASDRSEEHR
jgi:catechol 2,3-dioxygenase-like lactoylglutathione lyase family enzyme